MRVTQNMVFNNLQQRISDTNAEMTKYNEQVVTGKRFIKPSEDSLNATRSLGLKSSKANNDQYISNIDSGISYMSTVESTLGSVEDVLTQAKTLAIQGANATNNSEDRKAIALQVDQLLSRIYSLANTQHDGDYVFSGFKTRTAPFDPADATYAYAGDANNIQREVSTGTKLTINMSGSQAFGSGATSAFAVLKDLSNALNNNNPSTDAAATQGNITGGAAVGSLTITGGVNDTLNLSINGVAGTITIAAATYASGAALATEIQTKINAAAVFTAAGITATVSYNAGILTITSNTSGSTSKVNTISGNAAANLGINTGVGVSTDGVDAQVSILTGLGNIDTVLNQAINSRAAVGSRMISFDAWKARLQDVGLNTDTLISDAEDVDLAAAIMNLSRTENAYKASLASAARIMQLSLLDFLR